MEVVSVINPTDDKAIKRGNTILRQELVSATPKCGPKCSMLLFLILTIIFLTFGIPIIIIDDSKVEVSYDYTDW
jgi:hypothetical protein